MIAWLALLLQAAALAAGAAWAAAGLAVLAAGAARGLAPHARADALLLACVAPALAAGVAWVAVTLPSALHAGGIRADHCDAHGHHLHLCAVHAEAVHAPLVALGALATALAVWRLFGCARSGWSRRRALRALERLGTRSAGAFPVIRVPGSPWLCHAVGALRRRVLVSEAVARALPSRALAAALAHEEAHLARRDPLATELVELAGALAPPGFGPVRRAWREAAEEACDAAAAARCGALDVAEAIVSVARLQRGVRAGVPALGAEALERRVRSLLAGPRAPGPARAWAGLALVVALSAAGAIAGADALHHAFETALQPF